MDTSFDQALERHRRLFSVLDRLRPEAVAFARRVIDCLESGGKVLWCGNGGSAADAQHLAAEFMVRYRAERRPLPAIALTTDSSLLTAHSNDFSFDTLFARQVEALARPGDLLVGISTSGNSPNVVAAAEQARAMGVFSIALLGRDGGRLRELADLALIVPDDETARIQEAHIFIGHWICEAVDDHFARESGR